MPVFPVLPALVSLAATAAPPTDRDVDALVQALKGKAEAAAQSREGRLALEESAKEALARVDLGSASFKQIQKLGQGGLFASQRIREAIAGRLAELSAAPAEEGAQAASFRIIAFPGGPTADPTRARAFWDGYLEAYRALLRHPALGDLLRRESYEAAAVFAAAESVPADAWKASGLLPGFLPALEKKLMPSSAIAARKVFDLAMDPGCGVDAFTRERIRSLVLARTQEAFRFLESRGGGSPLALQAMARLEQARELLSGAWARGMLLDQPSPAVELLWCSDGSSRRIQDFKGKVVVLDFWATWCGPCIRSFPNLRKLQERYRDFPVVILGVTSPQGTHFDRKANRKIDTEGDPKKEFALMTGYRKDMDMTWTVAFSKQDVFNKDFGITGIPHVAILDAAGKVRFNNLRPYNPPREEADRIDALLKEAGLPCPPSPMEPGNYAEN